MPMAKAARESPAINPPPTSEVVAHVGWNFAFGRVTGVAAPPGPSGLPIPRAMPRRFRLRTRRSVGK